MIKVNILKSELVKRGYTVKDVAEWLGKSEPAIYRKLKGKSKMSIDDAFIICKHLELTNEFRGDIFLGD